ncbi:MAG: glycerophosphodiester phosphodiesterase family protein, partial [Bacteroidota bacterium]
MIIIQRSTFINNRLTAPPQDIHSEGFDLFSFMARYLFWIIPLLAFCSQEKRADEVSNASYVKVVAHRADWRNAPENSLLGVRNCIHLGVDMIEVDLAMTKDSILVLMHDKTLDRTTTGSGSISQWTYDSLRDLNLKNYDGSVSEEKIPTFKELISLISGKVEVFIDKGYEYIPQAYEVLKSNNALEQTHFLGFVSGDQFKIDYPMLYGEINYIPLILPIDTINSQIESYRTNGMYPEYYLFSFETENEMLLSSVRLITNSSIAMATTQTAKYCAGHTDSVSLENPEEGWGWIVTKGFNAICTDFPEELIKYLESKNL